MQELNLYQKVTIWLSGNDLHTARQCTSSEINKMTHEGLMIVIAPLIGIFSYTYAINYIFHELTIALLVGVILATVVLLLDRAILGYSRKNFSLGMVGRILLAGLLGFTLAEPIILKIFQPSIQEQLAQNVTTARQQAAKPFEREIATIQAKLDSGKARLHELQERYTREMDGTGGSGIRTKGPIYRQKYEDYEEYKQEYENLADSLRSQINNINQQKENRLTEVEQNKAQGLIAELRALHILGQNESSVFWASWILRLSLILIEMIPILIKISPTGDQGLYYELVDIFDRECAEITQELSGQRKKVAIENRAKAYIQKYFKAYNDKLQAVLNAKSDSAKYRMQQIGAMARERNEYKQKLGGMIQEPKRLKKLHDQIDQIFDDFVQTINDLDESSGDFSFEQV